ncbi:MAG: hypothetical protein HEQ29_00970 [Dolichospermum sp. LBC05a]|nr:hypothetical protein [Dolichospermum sp. OL01]MCO5795430.1 hypothetical protein [Dolichospermum sp. OL03]MCS6279990.1 hypothetical protein [Dolichospermum sp.]QSV57142.1 MAG: hypothetical protein HEQ29_00970 [Dolichospermum sp. LBC05a]
MSESGFTGFKDLQDLIKYFVCIHSVYSLIGGYPESDIFLVCIYPVNSLIGGYPESDLFCIYPVHPLIGGYPDSDIFL